MPIELKNSMRNSVLNLVTASGKCIRSRRQRPGPGASHVVGVVIVLSTSVIVFSFAAGRLLVHAVSGQGGAQRPPRPQPSPRPYYGYGQFPHDLLDAPMIA